MFQTLGQDLRYALRTLRQSPGFTLVAILTLALGIGANTTIFSVINAVLLRPLPYSHPDRLVLLAEHWPAFPILSVSYENYKDFRDQSTSYETVAAVQPLSYTLTGSGDPERVTGMPITASLLPMLGIQPVAGRLIQPDDDRVGGAPVVMISYALWQRRFAGSHDALGKTLTLDNNPYTLIGVLPARISDRGSLRSLRPVRAVGTHSAGRSQLAYGNPPHSTPEGRRDAPASPQ